MVNFTRTSTMKILFTTICLLGCILYTTSTILPHPNAGFSHPTYSAGKSKFGDIKLKFTEKDLNKSVLYASDIVDHLQRLETSLGWSQINVKHGSTAHGQLIESKPETEALYQGRQALVAAKASLYLMHSCRKFHLNTVDCAKQLIKYNFKLTPLSPICLKLDTKCDDEHVHSKYRSMDGSCNHETIGNKGQSFTSYRRLLFPEYLDRIYEPRRSLIKEYILPSPRLISSAFAKNKDAEDTKLTLAVMQWGQFIGHDLAHTVTSKMSNNISYLTLASLWRLYAFIFFYSDNAIECCTSTGSKLAPRYIHPFCAPVHIPSNDKVYSKQNILCMTYVRSMPAIQPGCSLGPVDQLNQATHYLDGSQIYGNDDLKSKSLRSLTGGELISTKIGNQLLLPISQDPNNYCQVQWKGEGSAGCFMSGDSRVNSQPQLTAMHTMWLREHNRIAKQLAIRYPHMSDEKLFQESRRIVIAEIQHITYDEWIKHILGKKYMVRLSKPSIFIDNVDPSISNSFATAAFRFIKSLMAGNIGLFKEDRSTDVVLKLRDLFNQPNIIQYPGYLDGLIRGLATQISQKADFEYVDDVSSFMYGNGTTGFDIISLDIQRGRDHGLPSYSAFRSLCGLPEVDSMEQFVDVISPKAIKIISQIYKHPKDVDLLVGGMLENPDEDSLLGPTFSCIILDQFSRTRNGDRYFYTHPNQPVPFTKSQLNEIRKASLARIFCDNGDDIQLMQPNVFQKVSVGNKLVKCNMIPKINLDNWLDS